ncbi:BQ2448_7075 [Microbotryum intermedium]|uniref:Conserved oligomeric Golgi complex subunit 7 n=1 Tax=Microbotryum intermedium TaxID=269621 RepID=A0A238FH55_9BASI|nr:BQ2448_7075 [Microbotryum intermedium]
MSLDVAPAPPPTSLSSVPALDLGRLADLDDAPTEAEWLNDLLQATLSYDTSSQASPQANLISLEASLGKTLAALEVATHDTSALVDRTIDDISRSVPRLAFDLQLMRENALLLRFTLDGIRKRAGIGSGFGENPEVSRVMEKLRVLDLAKARMEAARDVLREAESWSTLESEVAGLLGEQAYAKAAERLEEAARSMVVFQNTTEYEGRRALMVSLQNQLEASLSSSLVSAINTRDVKACKSYYAIFGQIQREAEFTAYYFGSRRSALVDAWVNANLIDAPNAARDLVAAGASTTAASASASTQASPSPPIKLTSFLIKFYGDLHALLAEERTYVPAIFPDPAPTISSFVSTTLEGLSPSLPQRLSAIADTYGPLMLPELIQAYRATEDFALSVDQIISKLDPSSVTPLATHGSSGSVSGAPFVSSPGLEGGAPVTPSKRDRRFSKRMSTSRRMGSRSSSFGGSAAPDIDGVGVPTTANHAAVRAWETAMFEPFLDWQVEYPELERQYLAHEVARLTGPSGTDVMGYLVEEGAGASSGSRDRKGGEKGARALWDLTSSVFALMEDAMSRSSAMTHGYAAAGLVEVIDGQLVAFLDRRKNELNGAKLMAGQARRGQGLRSDNEDEATFEGLEYSTEDWGTFQLGLRLLDTCRSITDRLASFENKLQTRLTILAQTIREAREDPLHYTIPGTTRGAITLLRQSALNSIELAQLLEPLERLQDASSRPPTSPITLALMPKARFATVEFTRATQLFLHETILAPLLAHLKDYAVLPTWTTSQDQRPGAKGAFDLSIPTFSLSPTETISRVGEGLFNLPRLFEVYAGDDALAFSLETLPHVDPEALRSLQPPSLASASPAHRPSLSQSRLNESLSLSPPAPSAFSRRSASVSFISMPSFHSNLSAETVISTWLSSLTLSILHHLTSVVLPTMHRLSKHGARQLVSDLDYMVNVARALDVEASDELEAWRDAAALEEKPGNEEELGMDKRVYERVARMRGWRKTGT